MSISIALALLLDILLKRLCEVATCLIGNTGEHPKKVGQLISKVLLCDLLAWFLALFAIKACHYPRDLPHLFGEDRHIGEGVEVTNAIRLNPFVHSGL